MQEINGNNFREPSHKALSTARDKYLESAQKVTSWVQRNAPPPLSSSSTDSTSPSISSGKELTPGTIALIERERKKEKEIQQLKKTKKQEQENRLKAESNPSEINPIALAFIDLKAAQLEKGRRKPQKVQRPLLNFFLSVFKKNQIKVLPRIAHHEISKIEQ